MHHQCAFGDAVRLQHFIRQRALHDDKQLFVGSLLVRVVGVLLQFVEKVEIPLADGQRFVPGFDISLARNDVLEIVSLPERARFSGMTDDIVGVGQRPARHGQMEKAVAVRAFVKIDDFVFSVAVHRPIILRLFQKVNAKKIQ